LISEHVLRSDALSLLLLLAMLQPVPTERCRTDTGEGTE
jgi:hypothetical protein